MTPSAATGRQCVYPGPWQHLKVPKMHFEMPCLFVSQAVMMGELSSRKATSKALFQLTRPGSSDSEGPKLEPTTFSFTLRSALLFVLIASLNTALSEHVCCLPFPSCLSFSAAFTANRRIYQQDSDYYRLYGLGIA